MKIKLRWAHASLIFAALDRKQAGESPLYAKIMRKLKGRQPGGVGYTNIEPQRNFAWDKERGRWEAREMPGFPESFWQFIGRNELPPEPGKIPLFRGPVVEFNEDLAKIVEELLREASKAQTRGGRAIDGSAIEPAPVIAGTDADALDELLGLIIPAWKMGGALDIELPWYHEDVEAIAALKEPAKAWPLIAQVEPGNRIPAAVAGKNGA